MSRLCAALLRLAFAVAFAYLYAGEVLPPMLLPPPARAAWFSNWATKQVVLVGTLSTLAVLLGSSIGAGGGGGGRISCAAAASANSLLVALNVVPIVAAVAHWMVVPGWLCVEEATCGAATNVLDSVGLLSARLARLDLGTSLLLAARGESSWLIRANGRLGYAEAIPLHRLAGWWCAVQSALHGVAYLLFYVESGGLASLWRNCFPAPLPGGELNRLGLVNGLGLLALLALLVLALPACPAFRRRLYHVFQRVHLPAALLFVLCAALHDLPVLLFAMPGLANWHIGRHGTDGTRRRLGAKARSLPDTSPEPSLNLP
jgi:hypothetical protein